jgi:hypothetical protein
MRSRVSADANPVKALFKMQRHQKTSFKKVHTWCIVGAAQIGPIRKGKPALRCSPSSAYKAYPIPFCDWHQKSPRNAIRHRKITPPLCHNPNAIGAPSRETRGLANRIRGRGGAALQKNTVEKHTPTPYFMGSKHSYTVEFPPRHRESTPEFLLSVWGSGIRRDEILKARFNRQRHQKTSLKKVHTWCIVGAAQIGPIRKGTIVSVSSPSATYEAFPGTFGDWHQKSPGPAIRHRKIIPPLCHNPNAIGVPSRETRGLANRIRGRGGAALKKHSSKNTHEIPIPSDQNTLTQQKKFRQDPYIASP